MKKLEFVCDTFLIETRIDKFISSLEIDLSRSAVQKLIEDGNVIVNSCRVSKSFKLSKGDRIEIIIPEPEKLDVKAQDLPLEIVYQDSDLIVVNKPKGMVVHPAAGNPDKTLVNALLFHCEGQLSGINGVIRPGIVHRIDKDTSGLLIVATSDKAHIGLAEQIKKHSFTREYCAVLCGRLKQETGIIDAPIGRDKFNRKKMCVTQHNSKSAVTHYEVLELFDSYTLVKFRLETGRTHQIRVHSAYIGHPVYGDGVYGKAVREVNGQCLHAKKIGFVHPISGEYLEFDSELPEYFERILKTLRK
ncbi:MAG: RluA family pseudouridine synthase [Oscillospiraceae bacterium]|jgi:23S rRNA pseudouridine1911/1915/1917 synthase